MRSPSNLPPGISENMIPGNRPEDEWFEIFVDRLEIPDAFFVLWNPEELARDLSEILLAIDREGRKEVKSWRRFFSFWRS